ncbi:hypothetical protein D9613_009752 [Agrocybe pediades]|uniref:Uncharacterized protein n=1 Tax=Agrocybe pediades TaxID=84607 RepID=A0A8H4VQ39_9AGAR|nr:hypothetical protein D9613_009752 [Agrocybe pediades]
MGCLLRLRRGTIDQAVIDIRSILEEHSGQMNRLVKAANAQCLENGVFLVLDKNVQELPLESMPILRERSVSHIPGIQFLHDRLAFAAKDRHPFGVSRKSYNHWTGAIAHAKKISSC